MMKKQGLLAAVLVAAMLMTSPAALAKKHRRTISEEEAAMIANSMIQGRVVDVDYEHRKHGRSYYEVEIRKDGRKYEVYVDAKTGELIDQDRVERDRDDDRIEIYPDYNGGGNYDPHGYYGYYGNHGHGEGYYDDDHDDDDDDD